MIVMKYNFNYLDLLVSNQQNILLKKVSTYSFEKISYLQYR